MAIFEYGETELSHLRSRDARLAWAIDAIGHIEREVDDDLFSSVVHQIVGQQISTKALATVWSRMQGRLGEVSPARVLDAGRDGIRQLGISYRKADYIYGFAQRVQEGGFDLAAVAAAPDEEAIGALCSLKGVGHWTAEMILLFCLQRPDVLAFDDLAIQRGMRMLYHHRRITPKLFARYRRRYSPYGSVASLYLWEIAGGAVPGMRDPARASSRRARRGEGV